MDSFGTNLNRLLVKLYRSIEKLEETMLSASRSIPLTISEIHFLEAVTQAGGEGVSSVRELSDYLGISPPSVTAAVNKLMRKGYVTKAKCAGDGRVVRVSLTRQGRRAERAHRYFHQSLIRSVTKDLTEEEKRVLLSGVEKLDRFLDLNIKKYQA